MRTHSATYQSCIADLLLPVRVLLFLFLISVSPLFSQSSTQLFEVANSSYKNKNYDLAIEAYQKLIDQGYKNAEIYYNLGNAYYKKDQIGLAVLNFEKAQKLSPADEDIRYNLKLANLKTVDRLSPVPQLAIIEKWQHFTTSQSSRSWAIISIVFVWLALIGFAIYLFISSLRRTGFYVGALMLFFAVFFGYLSYSQTHAEYGADQAILTAANAYIKSAPDASGTDLFMVHEGIKLNILDKVGDWSKVRLSDGKVGWIQHSTYTVI